MIRSLARSVSPIPPPCDATQLALLTAVVSSQLPAGSLASSDQLRSLCGVWSRDLCGLPLQKLSGSWDVALKALFGSPYELPQQTRRKNQLGKSRAEYQQILYRTPDRPQWVDPRPPPEPLTLCLGELVSGSMTWVTNDAMACDELIDELGLAKSSHLGLDLEWTPTMVRGQEPRASMLQLATRERCLLIRIGQMSHASSFPAGLRMVLSSTNPLKVGRGVREDARLIRRTLDLEPSGCTELPGRLSLKDMARRHTDLALPDSKRWMTNWDARVLPEDVLTYAAFDAIAAYEVWRRAKK